MPRVRWPNALLALVLIGCTAPVGAPVPSGSWATATAVGPAAANATVAPSFTRSPDPSTLSPSPAPTASPGSPSLTHHPESTHVPLADPDDLVLRVTTCGHVCFPRPGTTILADGRVIWHDWLQPPGQTMRQRQLDPAGLRAAREAIDASGLPDRDATFEPTKLSDPVLGHGITTYRFRRLVDGHKVTVVAADPGEFDADNEYRPGTWAIPDEMRTLSDLARGVLEPATWFSEDGWSGPEQTFVADGFVLLVQIYRSDPPEAGRWDVSEVPWPFEEPITSLGEPYTVGGMPMKDARCLPITPETMAAVATAEASVSQEQRPALDISSTMEIYNWAEEDATVYVTSLMLLPDQPFSCEDGGRW